MKTIEKKKIALRIDDIGASSKQFEVYSKKWYGFGNFLFLKRINYFKAWGPYEEMTAEQWEKIFQILVRYNAKITVGVTACWVEYSGEMVPFFKKFPEEASILKQGVALGLVDIANHGLTHCILNKNLFRPQLFSSNRKFHREFWEWVPKDVQFDHLKRSQELLAEFFKKKIITFVPPGNVYSDSTLEVAKELGIKYVNCNKAQGSFSGLEMISNENIFAFHDKEIVENGTEWLENILSELDNTQFIFVNELGNELVS